MLKHTGVYHKRLRKISEPIRDYFGVDIFGQYTIEENGRFTNLGNCLDTASYHYEGGIYVDNPLFVQPELCQEGYYYLPDHPDWRAIEKKMFNKCPVQASFSVCRKDQTGKIWGFVLSCSRDQTEMRSRYFNGIPLIDMFIDYWLDSTADIYHKVLADGVNLAELKGRSFHHPLHLPFEEAKSREDKVAFLRQIGVDERLLTTCQRLTKREREVLQYTSQGKTALETGKTLHISRRTVENHVQNLKDKFLVTGGKPELISYGQQLDHLGLLG